MDSGRPPAFESPEVMESIIQDYFQSLKELKVPPTITGLCYFLGFESRQSFYDYEKKPEFTYTIKRARLRIESTYESNLHGNSNAGSIFALKNFGWTDKQEIDQKTEISGSISVDYAKLSDAALSEIASLDRPKESAD